MIEVGDTASLEFQVVNPQMSRVDATVVLTVDQPDGVSVTPTVTRVDTGIYTASFVPSMPGRHTTRWAATGTAQRSSVDVLNVAPNSDSTAIISLAEAREHLNIADGETVEDEEIRGFIAAASAAVERHTGQIVARRTITETHTVAPGAPLILRPPVLRVVSAIVDGTAADVSNVLVDGFIGFVTGLSGQVAVTYEAGMARVPDNFITATQIICAHLWQTQRVQTLGSGPTFGGDTSFSPQLGLGYALPNRALELLGGRAPNMP